MKQSSNRFEGILFGVVLGGVLTIAAEIGYHQLNGMIRISRWERDVADRQQASVAEIMQAQLTISRDAMQDGRPLAATEYLAFDFMEKLYGHHMIYAVSLLKAGEIEHFNTLRARTPYLLYNLSQEDLSGLQLAGANLSLADLSYSDLSGCDLSGSNLSGADLHGADLGKSKLDSTVFFQANLTGAVLNGVFGKNVDVREAVLANASLTGINGLEEARFDRAIFADANLWNSHFPGAVFDGADMTMVSAVDSDLARVASMADIKLTGAVLSGADLAPERCPRAWLVNAQGLESETVGALRANGAIVRAEEVLDVVDPRIVAGFRAQIEENPEITPEQRQPVLLEMLQEYYQQS